MPETKITCPKCGNETEPGTPVCPSCGETLAKPGFMGKLQATIGAILATTRTHKWWWAGGGGAVVAAAVAAIVVFGGFLGPSGKAVCTATLGLAKDYGVIPMSAKLASNSAESTNVKNRKKCTATADSDTYNLLTDVKCKDVAKKKSDCVALYSVARSDGLTTYQVREIPPDQTDEAVEAAEKKAAEAQAGSMKPLPGLGGDGGTIDTETTVDNSLGGVQQGPHQ